MRGRSAEGPSGGHRVRWPKHVSPDRLMGPGIRGDLAERLVWPRDLRSEEHTSELQSRQYLVCRLLLEKKKKISDPSSHHVSSSKKATYSVQSRPIPTLLPISTKFSGLSTNTTAWSRSRLASAVPSVEH